ncbi:MAG: hypothetical protein JWQ40_1759 [Segetibacter sp.]|jgi:hypothetical protein|nr:hypothetical protein [Segetibacter sp.]
MLRLSANTCLIEGSFVVEEMTDKSHAAIYIKPLKTLEVVFKAAGKAIRVF